MITRYAVFQRRVKAGKEKAMKVFVNEQLAPLWQQFKGAQEVRVLYGLEKGPHIPLTLAITYPSKKAMQIALASPARYASRDRLAGFMVSFLMKKPLSLHNGGRFLLAVIGRS